MASSDMCCFQIKSSYRSNPTCTFNKCIRFGEQQDFCSKHFVPPDEHRCVCTTGNAAQKRCKSETIGVQVTGNNRQATEIRVCSLHFNMHSDFGVLGVIHPDVPNHDEVFQELNSIRDAVFLDQKRLVTRDRLGNLTVRQGRHYMAGVRNTVRPPPPPPLHSSFSFGDPSVSIDCGVCLDSCPGNQCIKLPCNHTFCALCILRVSNRVCPMCRAHF